MIDIGAEIKKVVAELNRDGFNGVVLDCDTEYEEWSADYAIFVVHTDHDFYNEFAEADFRHDLEESLKKRAGDGATVKWYASTGEYEVKRRS